MCAIGVFFVGCTEVEYIDDEITEIIDESESIINELGRSSVNQNKIDVPKVVESKPQTAKKSKKITPKIDIVTPTKSKLKSNKFTPKSTNHTKKNLKNNSSTIKVTNAKDLSELQNYSQDSQSENISSDSLNLFELKNIQDTPKDSFDSPTIQPLNSPDSLDLQNLVNSQNSQDSRIFNKSIPRVRTSFDSSKLNQPLSQLQVQCDLRDLQKCEDLGRIYAVQEKHDLATAHYKMACNNGKGMVMSCFFLSLIYANNGNDTTSSKYFGVIDSDELNARKIDEVELLLSISEIVLVKDKLKISCVSGESTSCRILLNIFKIRGEIGEARAFFNAECKRIRKANATPCTILKAI